ncbi:type II toxin-antitoxin system RelE/ParE family toxin [Halomonas qaidamensis]|uniref:Type II toxin-antitoxin system RelE/ParE family toxin n=1 Tax=Halomonas qaidamensis TaxID=2866211 RepID=A0ABY6JQJ6_9GAMM|nr:type II toxin-antitoxin system RelE/ParE family toxin [Halomonas qaidamensis]UYV19359.1 type II toxin-antitoxin system RelE/ParE family toxin [Halomonas qaidamensis]
MAAMRVLTRLNRLATGNAGDAKTVGDGVMELRIDYGPGYRVYYAKVGRRIVMLLVGGTKKRQQADIDQAKAFLNDHRRRAQT